MSFIPKYMDYYFFLSFTYISFFPSLLRMLVTFPHFLILFSIFRPINSIDNSDDHYTKNIVYGELLELTQLF